MKFVQTCLVGLILWVSKFAYASETKIFNDSPVIVFLGAPCSGKGTQVDLLTKRLNVPALQSGILFRKEVQSGSDLGAKFAPYMDSGKLIPNELTIDLITKTLSSPKYENGVIMDGYPRSSNNLQVLEEILKNADLEIDFVVILDVDYEVLKARVEKRLVCQNCGKSTSMDVNPESVNCCDSKNLSRRKDDSIGPFEVRYGEYLNNTVPLIEEVQSKYPEKIVYLGPEILSNPSKDDISDIIFDSMINLPFKRIRPSIGALEFDKPFEWLLKFVKSGKAISFEDVRFYLLWALDCNKPDQSGLLRRIVFIATTSKSKFLEYRKTFLLYGIEVIRFPVVDDQNVITWLLSAFDTPQFSAIALLSDTSNLYNPRNDSASIEDIENDQVKLCKMKDGARCINYCVLNVTYAVKDPNSLLYSLKSYKLMDKVEGTIRTSSSKISPFVKVFGWDNIFHVKGLGKSYQELREAGFKNSARDRVISAFLRRHIHYKNNKNLKFNPVNIAKSVDFSINMVKYFEGIDEYNLDLVKEYGFTNIWKRMVQSGIFFRAAAFRRIGIYWNPGVNGGLPLVKKADKIHEITYMAHDIGHQLLPDLVFTGLSSFAHKRVYIMWRMMSEAFTMALTDMIFIDALKQSGVEYDFNKRKIYPLFSDLNMNVSPKNNESYLENIRKIVHANFMYCLRGDDSEYRELISKSGNVNKSEEELFANLEAFKLKYAPFFVEDFRWTEQNYNSMVSTRSIEAKKWWERVQELNDLLGEFRIKSIDEFMNDLGSNSVAESENLYEAVFSIAFDKMVSPVITSPPESYDLNEEDDSMRKFRAFTRWMIGQLSICFKYDFIPESGQVFSQISDALKGLNGRIDDEEISRIRGVYDDYLSRLHEVSLISADDFATYSQVYPLFDPMFVNYDKNISEYESLSSISSRILTDRPHHYSTYHRQAERIWGRFITTKEKEYLNNYYLMVESSGGNILNGIFSVEPGVMVMTETAPVSSDSAVSVLLAGISVETSLELIAHHETKVARLTSSKTKAMNLPLFEVNNYDVKMIQYISNSLKSRLSVPTDDANFENNNLTLPACKSTFANFTATLKDWHSILIGRLGNPRGNETSVINVATKICKQLNEKYPDYIRPLEYYLSSKNHDKYSVSKIQDHVVAVETRLLPETIKLFHDLNIPSAPNSISSFISMADFNARLTYASFSKKMPSFSDSVNFVKKIVVNEGHASILSSFQVVSEGKTRRTKELFTERGWDLGIEPLLLLDH